ncbi:MAG TPA: phage holin family protein [Acidimicrobiia bacterium]|nr:phage holin family protein [Acidimicrobiia bacterium]
MADWTTQAADAIENAVATVRDKTVVPARKATKAVVYGLLATFFGLTAVVLAVIGLFRVLVVLTGDVWIAYLIVGGIFVVGGTFCWAMRAPRAPKGHA